jgi:hypothetical protein
MMSVCFVFIVLPFLFSQVWFIDDSTLLVAAEGKRGQTVRPSADLGRFRQIAVAAAIVIDVVVTTARIGVVNQSLWTAGGGTALFK